MYVYDDGNLNFNFKHAIRVVKRQTGTGNCWSALDSFRAKSGAKRARVNLIPQRASLCAPHVRLHTHAVRM